MINSRRRRIDLGSVALTATLFSIYAGARSSARALGVARALLP